MVTRMLRFAGHGASQLISQASAGDEVSKPVTSLHQKEIKCTLPATRGLQEDGHTGVCRAAQKQGTSQHLLHNCGTHLPDAYTRT